MFYERAARFLIFFCFCLNLARSTVCNFNFIFLCCRIVLFEIGTLLTHIFFYPFLQHHFSSVVALELCTHALFVIVQSINLLYFMCRIFSSFFCLFVLYKGFFRILFLYFSNVIDFLSGNLLNHFVMFYIYLDSTIITPLTSTPSRFMKSKENENEQRKREVKFLVNK